MLRYFRLIQVAVLMLGFSAVMGGLYALYFFKEMAISNTTDMYVFIQFVVNTSLCISLVASIYYSKKYLYNFNYFGISNSIQEEDNLLPTSSFRYDPADYEEVPEPFKLRVPVYILLVFSSLSVLLQVFYVLIPLLYFLPAVEVFDVSNFFSTIRRAPMFYTSLIPTFAIFFHSITMFFQIRYYTRYYEILIKNPEGEISDLTHELHENK